MANTIKEWVVMLSYLVDKAGQNQVLQSAKQTTQALNQEAAKQAEAARKSEAERIAGALRVSAFLQGKSKEEIAKITAGSAQVTQIMAASAQRQTQIVQTQSRAVVAGAQSQANAQIQHAVRSGQALALYRSAQAQGYTQMVSQIGTSMRNFAGHVTTATTAAGRAVHNFGSVVSTVHSATRPFFLAVGGAAISVGANVGILTNQLDKLYNLAKRTGSSATDIRALRQSLSMMGGSDAEADAAITSVSNALLANRGNVGFLKGIGINPNQGTVGILEDFSKFIRQMPSDTAIQYGNVIGLSPEMVRYLQSGDFVRQMRRNRETLKDFSEEEERSMRAGKELADQWRTLMFGAGIQNRSLFRTIIEASGEALGTFNTWLKNNAKSVSDSIRTFTKTATDGFIRLATYFTQVFADTPEGEKLRAEWAKWFNDRLKDAVALKNAIVTIAEVLVGFAKFFGIPYTAGKDLKAAVLRQRKASGETLSPEDEQRIKEADERRPGQIDAGKWMREMGTSMGGWLKNLLVGPAEANTDASKGFKDSVGKFDKAVDRLTGGPMGGPGGVGGGEGGAAAGGASGGFWSGIKGAFAGRSAALGGTGEGIAAGFQRGYSGGTGVSAADMKGTGAGHAAPKADRIAHARAYALSKGLDPDAVVGTMRGEGLNKFEGDYDATGKPTSFGDFQLHVPGVGRNTAPGMGQGAQAAGIDITDPKQWQKANEYAIDQMAKFAKQGAGALQGQWHGMPGWAAQRLASGKIMSGAAAAAAAVKQSDFVNELQSGIRNKPISDQLRGVFDAAGRQTGLIADITSGGQDAHGPRRTGSHRHDVGEGQMGAADLKLRDAKTGEIMDLRNPAHRSRIAGYVAAARAGGATGMGAGLEYMGPNTLHIGGGRDNTWGSEAGFLAGAKEQQQPQPSVLNRIRSTAANVAKGVSDIVIPEAKGAGAKGFDAGRFDAVKSSGDFASPGRYIGPSQTTDNSKKIDFDAIYNTTIQTNEPKQAATSFQRAHEQLNSMSQRQLQGMYR